MAKNAAKTHTDASGDDLDCAPDALSDAIGYHLRLAQEASFQAFQQRVGNPDLKPGRYSILTILAENPGLTPTELSRACGRDKSTLTPALKDLVARDLVQRHHTPDDQRSYKVSLTLAGERLLRKLRTHAQAHDRALDRIVGARKTEFLAILRRIAAELSDAAQDEDAPSKKPRARAPNPKQG